MAMRRHAGLDRRAAARRAHHRLGLHRRLPAGRQRRAAATATRHHALGRHRRPARPLSRARRARRRALGRQRPHRHLGRHQRRHRHEPAPGRAPGRRGAGRAHRAADGLRMDAESRPQRPSASSSCCCADSLVLDWAGPAEALRIANQLLRAQRTAARASRWSSRARGPTSVTLGRRARSAAWRRCRRTWAAARPGWCWSGCRASAIAVDNAEARDLLHWLRGLRLETRPARTGHGLRRRRAGRARGPAGRPARHHAPPSPGRTAARSSRAATWCANRVFVLDAPVYSSAGVTTGIDLVLHRIGRDLRRGAGGPGGADHGGGAAARPARPGAVALSGLPQPPACGAAPRAGRGQRAAAGRLERAAHGRRRPTPRRAT